MLSLILGKMVFAAISLLPSESLHSADSPSSPLESQLQDNRLVPPTLTDNLRSISTRLWRSDVFNQFPPANPPEGPLLLWGLTLGVLSDFLDLLPPHDALTLWTYPNFTPLDVRIMVWLMTYRFKQRKRVELQSGSDFLSKPSFGYASESLAHSVRNSSPASSTVLVNRPDETGFHGLGTGVSVSSSTSQNQNKKAVVSTMLEGFVESLAVLVLPEVTNRARYYDIVRRAVAVALVGRVSMVVLLAALAWRRLRRTREVELFSFGRNWKSVE